MSQKSVGDIPLIDQAIAYYTLQGQDFKLLFEQHFHFLHPIERYVFSSPKYLILGEVMEDKEHGKYWMVSYAASTVSNPFLYFFNLAPYKLDFIAFSRYRNTDKIKFYKWNKLYRYAKFKNSTNTAASPTTASTAAASTDTSSSETY